jgi:hypothetical protein
MRKMRKVPFRHKNGIFIALEIRKIDGYRIEKNFQIYIEIIKVIQIEKID